MINAIRTRLNSDEEGFTLIELLVVVIIIGILAAIAVPTFLSQREKAGDSAAKADLRNGAIAQESYFTDNNGTSGAYTATEADLVGHGFKRSGNMLFGISVVAAAGAVPASYCMAAKHAQSPRTWYLTSTSGAPVTAAAAPAGCPAPA